MVKLLIIADDFTGALDTGIQFVNKGIATQVFTKMPEAIWDIDESTEVLVIDSETRPMPAAKAYDTVKNITGWAKAIKIPVIFKKTDSALRGNIGSELQAVLDGSGHDKVYFLPGYPKIDRCTVNGTHYIQGQLLEKSVFWQDPFEPVKLSYIPDIIAQQTALRLRCIKSELVGKRFRKCGTSGNNTKLIFFLQFIKPFFYVFVFFHIADYDTFIAFYIIQSFIPLNTGTFQSCLLCDNIRKKMSFVLLPDVPHLRKRLPTSSDLMQRSRKAIGRVKIFLWNVAA